MTEQKTIAEQSFMELLAGLKSSIEKLSTLAGKPIHLRPLPKLPKKAKTE